MNVAKRLRSVIVTVEDDRVFQIDSSIHRGPQALAAAVAEFYQVEFDGLVQGLSALLVRLETERVKEVNHGY